MCEQRPRAAAETRSTRPLSGELGYLGIGSSWPHTAPTALRLSQLLAKVAHLHRLHFDLASPALQSVSKGLRPRAHHLVYPRALEVQSGTVLRCIASRGALSNKSSESGLTFRLPIEVRTGRAAKQTQAIVETAIASE